MVHNKRVMIMPSPPNSGSIGSTTKCIGIARELVKRGCEVAFVMGGKPGELISKNGFKVYMYPAPVPKGNTQNITSAVDYMEWTGMVEEGFVEASINAELEAIRDFRPDVIFAESRPSASISSKAAGVPSVMIACWPCHPEFPGNAYCPENYTRIFNKQLKRYKLEEISNITELLYMRADIKLAPTLPELEPEMQFIDGIRYTGYMLDLDYDKSQIPDWYSTWNDLPQIFIYLSVSAIPPQIYGKVILETFENMPFRVICSCGYHYNLKALPEALPNVRFSYYVPAAAIMKDTSLIIFHGGQDTMLTALLHGLPSITIPGQHFERDYNTSKLAELGATRKMPIHAFRPNRLKSVINDVLIGSYGSNSKKLSEKLKSYGGTAQCADILADMTGT